MTNWHLTNSGVLSFQAGDLRLENAVAVINGAELPGGRWEAASDDAHLLRFTTGGVSSPAVELRLQNLDGDCTLQITAVNLAQDFSLDSFGLRFECVENLRAYLRSGYHSWDGSSYVEPANLPDAFNERAALETGHAFTQLLPEQGSRAAVLGFERHDRFQTTFHIDTRRSPCALTILTHWDRKAIAGGRAEAETLRVFDCADVEEGLRRWAHIAAAASQPAPRLSAGAITGWCSWYNLYAAISEENLLDHLRAAAQTMRPTPDAPKIFQIDDGFTPEMGDWLEIKPQFPRGVKPLLDDIRAAGFIPGLWIAPFLVGNRSHLFQQHPDWVVRQRSDGAPLIAMRFYGEFRWHKRSEEYYVLDATHPDALAYLRRVFHIWRHEWGCEYFKTDFMFHGAHYGPETAVYHTPGLTRVEIWQLVAEMIREEIGDALWIGCGCPLWAAVGRVDAVRIGRDVGVRWEGDGSAQSLIRDGMNRNFANHILWQADPDSVLLRDRFHHLSDAEIEALAVYAGMMGGVMTTSENMEELSGGRKTLWGLIQPQSKATCRFPLLGRSRVRYHLQPGSPPRLIALEDEPLIAQVRPMPDGAALHLFNSGEQALEKDLPLADLGLPGGYFLWRAGETAGSDRPLTHVHIRLEAHSSVLLWATRAPLDRLPQRLP